MKNREVVAKLQEMKERHLAEIESLEKTLKAETEVTVGDRLSHTKYERMLVVCKDPDKNEFFLVREYDDEDRENETINSKRVKGDSDGYVKVKDLFAKESNAKYWEVL